MHTKAKVTRSKVSNGRKLWLPGVDGRSPIARRARDIHEALTTDLGNDLTEAQKQLVRRSTLLAVRCEEMERDAMMGERIDFELFGKAAERLRRLLTTLGLERRMRDITPTVDQYLATADHS